MVRIVKITAENFKDLADRIEPCFKYLNGRFSVYDVFCKIRSGEFFVAESDKSVMLLTFCDYPSKRALVVFMAAGDVISTLETWNSFLDQTAKENSCDCIELVGRKGWVKALRGVGYHELAVLVEKDLR